MANKGKCQVCPKFSESRCSWCKLVFYCSKEHQKQDWPHHKETCTKKKYRLEENEELGRHLVATEDIKPDLILLKDKPLVLSYKVDTLEYTRNRICVGCYKEIPIEPRELRKKAKSGGHKVDKKQGSGLQSGNNEDNDEEKDDNDEESSSSEDDADDDEDDDDDESDDSDDEDNDDDEPEKVCLSCHLPVCSAPCSSQYFHKNFECKLLREAAASRHHQQQLQQNSASSSASTSTPLALPEPGVKTQNPGKKAGATSVSSLSSPVSLLESNSSSSNQEPMSLGTTCINTSCSRSSTNRTTSISNGIREALLRNLLYFRCLLLKHVNEGHWNELISLQSNEESRNDVTSLEKTTRIHTLIKKTLAEINHPTVNQVFKPDLHKLIGIIEINAVNISVSQNVEVSGIFPNFSMMEHSCIPSVKYYLVPCSSEKKNKTSTFFELYCRSAVKLKSGDHLSVAYTNAMWNTEKRREFLKKEKHFWCDCVRCKDPWELGSNFSTILCPLQECKAASVPVLKNPTGGGAAGATNSHEIQWKCTAAKCEKTCAAWQVKKVDTKFCEMVGKTKPSIESYKECLAKMEELVHPDYYLCCIVTHSLIQMYGHDTASVHDKALLEEKIALCNKLLAMIKKLDPGLAVLNIYASVVFYEMHSAILALGGAEVDEDYHILRNNPETVNLAKVYLQKCIECFKYEFLELPENKLKVLAAKKMEYLNLVMNSKRQ
ncbi:Protein msta, isoform A [Orchesella cincta]|uniref:Protein msta, isoform A n=1 Tax=Orchesella cincta TaxID=48709 RepID=A0A1D2NM52_ORCCI|nr:Protein msta, isoform A [Orchesella cincta]